MNYLLYVLAAYTVTFVLIGVMFVTSYKKYRRAKLKLEPQTVEEEIIEN